LVKGVFVGMERDLLMGLGALLIFFLIIFGVSFLGFKSGENYLKDLLKNKLNGEILKAPK